MALRLPSIGWMADIVDVCVDRLDRAGNHSALDLALLELLTAMARICLGQDFFTPDPLKHMRGVLGCLSLRCNRPGPGVVAACNLLGLLLVKGSGATPAGWPIDATTYGSVPSFLVEAFPWVHPCLSLVAQHGDSAVAFMLHHGLLDKSVNVLYKASRVEGGFPGQPGEDIGAVVRVLTLAWRVAGDKVRVFYRCCY